MYQVYNTCKDLGRSALNTNAYLKHFSCKRLNETKKKNSSLIFSTPKLSTRCRVLVCTPKISDAFLKVVYEYTHIYYFDDDFLILANFPEILPAATKTGLRQKKCISMGENKQVRNSVHGSSTGTCRQRY